MCLLIRKDRIFIFHRRLVDLPSQSDKATRQIESSNIYDEVAHFDSIANAILSKLLFSDF